MSVQINSEGFKHSNSLTTNVILHADGTTSIKSATSPLIGISGADLGDLIDPILRNPTIYDSTNCATFSGGSINQFSSFNIEGGAAGKHLLRVVAMPTMMSSFPAVAISSLSKDSSALRVLGCATQVGTSYPPALSVYQASADTFVLDGTTIAMVTTVSIASKECAIKATGKPINSQMGFTPFTGVHFGFTTETNLRIGDVVISSGAENLDVYDSLIIAETSSTPKDKRVVGVLSTVNSYSSTDNLLESYNSLSTISLVNDKVEKEWTLLGYKLRKKYEKFTIVNINSIGEGGINVCEENGDIFNGDYLVSSSIKGKAMKQDDDLLHNYTIAKSLQQVIWVNEQPGENGCFIQNNKKCKMIGCTYHCG